MSGAQTWTVIGLLAAVFAQIAAERWTWMRRIEDRFDRTDGRFDRVDGKLDHLTELLARMDERLKAVEARP